MREDLILRSVYMPPSDDSELRQLAFDLKVSKNALIRYAIANQLKAWRGLNDRAKLREEIQALDAA